MLCCVRWPMSRMTRCKHRHRHWIKTLVISPFNIRIQTLSLCHERLITSHRLSDIQSDSVRGNRMSCSIAGNDFPHSLSSIPCPHGILHPPQATNSALRYQTNEHALVQYQDLIQDRRYWNVAPTTLTIFGLHQQVFWSNAKYLGTQSRIVSSGLSRIYS